MTDEERAVKLAVLNDELVALLKKYENVAVIAVVIGVQGEPVEGRGFRISDKFMVGNHVDAAHLFTPGLLAMIAERQREVPRQAGFSN